VFFFLIFQPDLLSIISALGGSENDLDLVDDASAESGFEGGGVRFYGILGCFSIENRVFERILSRKSRFLDAFRLFSSDF
jgi:hypothetical protein